jgi:hypothetical protein
MCTLREVADEIDALRSEVWGLNLNERVHQNPDDTTTPLIKILVRLQENPDGPETFLWVHRDRAESETFRDMGARLRQQPQPFRRVVTRTVNLDDEFVWDGRECWSADEAANAIVDYMRERLQEAEDQPFY